MHMRVVLFAGLLALGACNPNGGGPSSDGAKPAGTAAAPKPGDDSRGAEIKATPTTTPTQATALPAGFPDDPIALASQCIVYIGLSQKAGVNPGGHDGTSVDLVVKQWRAALTAPGRLSPEEAQQLISSSVNPLTPTPPAQRDAASAWCVAHAPVK